jgi:hypothetical protein
MTVSFLFGWEHVMAAVLLVVVLAVVFFVMAASGRNVSERAEFQAWLDARSNGSPDHTAEGRDPAPAQSGARDTGAASDG